MVFTRFIKQEDGRLTQQRMSFMGLSVALCGAWLWLGSSMLVTKDMEVSLFFMFKVAQNSSQLFSRRRF